MKAQVVSFRCTVKNQFGQVISSTFNQDVVTAHSEQGQHFLVGLAEGLRDLRTGEHRKIAVSAERAYGFYDPEKVIVCPVDCFEGQALKVGQSLTCMFRGHPTEFRLTSIQDEEVTLDANHPLAGQDLVFEIEAVSAREALPEEIPGNVESDVPAYH
jgi:FKBP-type peptidyl-prolyl cis-trans isomerase SlyD